MKQEHRRLIEARLDDEFVFSTTATLFLEVLGKILSA